jgi:hypothetical protein
MFQKLLVEIKAHGRTFNPDQLVALNGPVKVTACVDAPTSRKGPHSQIIAVHTERSEELGLRSIGTIRLGKEQDSFPER